MLKGLLKSREDKALGARLCAAIGKRAREPVFFTELGVPDTIDGRFDLVTLHAWLVLQRMRAAGMKNSSQALIDALFASFDESLRDLGVGDIGIGHRMKKMADAFYGRLAAYGGAADEAELTAAILRNVYRGEAEHEEAAGRLARYAMKARACLDKSDLSRGDADFGALPAA
ncbi:MAG: ubiquinol-cytochrome C chaperone family protein [Rhizomicrobium sp.]